jgi:hypothetical protein
LKAFHLAREVALMVGSRPMTHIVSHAASERLRAFAARVVIFPLMCSVALTMVAMSAPCAAQQRVDVTPFVGFEPQTTLFGSTGGVPCVETLPGEVACPNAAVSENAALGFGARLTTWVGKRVALDLSVGRWDAGSDIGSATADMTTGCLGVLFNFTSPDSAGFFVVGGLSFVSLGGSTYSSGSPYASSQTDWGPVLGVGARVPFSPTLALRVEVEDYLYRLTDVGGQASGSAGQHSLVFSAGPSVTLGGGRLPPSVTDR